MAMKTSGTSRLHYEARSPRSYPGLESAKLTPRCYPRLKSAKLTRNIQRGLELYMCWVLRIKKGLVFSPGQARLPSEMLLVLFVLEKVNDDRDLVCLSDPHVPDRVVLLEGLV